MNMQHFKALEVEFLDRYIEGSGYIEAAKNLIGGCYPLTNGNRRLLHMFGGALFRVYAKDHKIDQPMHELLETINKVAKYQNEVSLPVYMPYGYRVINDLAGTVETEALTAMPSSLTLARVVRDALRCEYDRRMEFDRNTNCSDLYYGFVSVQAYSEQLYHRTIWWDDETREPPEFLLSDREPRPVKVERYNPREAVNI